MFKYNKFRYWFGLPCVVQRGNKFVISKKTAFIFGRKYLGINSDYWYSNNDFYQYAGLHESAEGAYLQYMKACVDVVVD